ncbi:MAG TPA: hypothetical protein VM537_19295, partial [Anaerolineae bacterium]|nr:hypothetical protein [Anaerolineae bacterium]
MAANLTKIIKGIQMYDRDGSAVTVDAFPIDVDPSAGGGVAANAGSLALRDVAGAGTSGELWVKTGAADTAWTKLDTGGGSAIEEGFLRAFVGKSGTGSELPTYTSTNVVTASANLEVAIGEIDTEIGAGVSATGRTQNDVSDQAINLNIAALSSAIGADADMPATLNYIALASTVYANLKSLDTQSKAVQDAVDALETGQKWIEAMVVVTATDLSAQSGLAVTWSDDDGGAPTLLAGDRVYSTADDTIYVAAAGAWGAGTAAVAGETFFSGVNLLDPVNQEKGAGFTYNGAATVKVADFDFELATTINLSGSYTAANGTVVASESVESALQKLAGNQIDLTTL